MSCTVPGWRRCTASTAMMWRVRRARLRTCCSEIADRLRRLAAAYGEWAEFDACAYFDLRREQAARLVRVVERVSTVHVTFYADALLPSFQAAEACHREHYASARLAAYAALRGTDDLTSALRQLQAAQIRMAADWRRAVAVAAAARTCWTARSGFWRLTGERTRLRHGRGRGSYSQGWVWPEPCYPTWRTCPR